MLGISSYLPQKEDTTSAKPQSEGESTSAEPAEGKDATPTVEASKKEEEEAKKEEGEMESEGYKEDIMEGVGEDDMLMLKVCTWCQQPQSALHGVTTNIT